MAVIMDSALEARLDRIGRREWWPVALLAEALGRPKMFVYRKIDAGEFDILNDGRTIKVISQSVIDHFLQSGANSR